MMAPAVERAALGDSRKAIMIRKLKAGGYRL
jgi:hypothetical protein